MSLPYYKTFGWEPVVITVDERFAEGYRDPLLNETVPEEVEIHKVKAWPVNITRKIGLGSISIRSYFHFKKKGNEILKNRKFDLIFFSTTMFHVCALGRYWKKKFNVPFVVDFQDPWRNDFYINNPLAVKPSKFWISYVIHKKMEAYTMPFSDGIMAVSQGYIDTLFERYNNLKKKPFIVLPFGTSSIDFELTKKRNVSPEVIRLNENKIKVVYVGVVTQFFLELIKAFFIAFKQVNNNENYHFYFIGTNYADGDINKSVEGLASILDLQYMVTEVPKRISYFSAIATGLHADILFIPGSLDPDYNASKVYNNIKTGKPLFSIFHEKSLVKKIIEETNAGIVIGINNNDNEASLIKKINDKLPQFSQLHIRTQKTDLEKMESFEAKAMTIKQTDFFKHVIQYKNK